MLLDHDTIKLFRTRRRIIVGLFALAVVGGIGMTWRYATERTLPPPTRTREELKASYLPATLTTASGLTRELLLEVADEERERSYGLMFRRSLAKNSGMLFIFPEETHVPFFMKNTLLPLDVLFLAADGRIVDWLPMTPCTADPCPYYYSVSSYRYALELNGGTADTLKLAKGDRVTFTLPTPTIPASLAE